MKASTYERRWVGPVADAILKKLMDYHGCSHHAGANSGACLADFIRTDLIGDVLDQKDVATFKAVRCDGWQKPDGSPKEHPPHLWDWNSERLLYFCDGEADD